MTWPIYTYFVCIALNLSCPAWSIEDSLPPAYLEARDQVKSTGTETYEATFPTPRLRADCRNGYRIGQSIGGRLVRAFQPSCDDLLNPLGNEWLPVTSGSGPSGKPGEPLGMCFARGFASRMVRHVYDTSMACAWQLNADVLFAAQIEYNRCYLKAAEQAATAELAFANLPFRPGEYTLIPRPDMRWDEFLDLVRGGYGEQPGVIDFACEIGLADAQSAKEPRQLTPLEP